MKNQILIAVALLISGYFLQSCGNANNSTDNKEMDTAMPDMAHNDAMTSDKMQMDNDMMQAMGEMKEMKMTGDFDVDFASMMITHHQSAIDMSEVEIAKGTDAQIKTMAQNIITAQKAEIEQMQAFAKNYKMPETKMVNTTMHQEMGETMKDMMDKMHGMQMTGNTDKDFVMMMITHHESAVTMAESEVMHGKQPELKKMAQKMIVDQKEEIAAFKAWESTQK